MKLQIIIDKLFNSKTKEQTINEVIPNVKNMLKLTK